MAEKTAAKPRLLKRIKRPHRHCKKSKRKTPLCGAR